MHLFIAVLLAGNNEGRARMEFWGGQLCYAHLLQLEGVWVIFICFVFVRGHDGALKCIYISG